MKRTETLSNGQTITIETRWRDLAWLPFTVVLTTLVWLQPLQKLYRHARLVKFCVVGGTSTVAALTTLWLLTDVVGVHYLASNMVAALISTVIWFIGNAKWTFGDRKTTVVSVPKTLLVRVAAISLHEGLLALFVEVFGVWYITGAVLATLVEFMLSYAVSNKWIWRRRRS